MQETLGLYLSIPFCRSKCTFCNFASGVFPSDYMERYVGRLVEDLSAARGCAREWGAVLPEEVDSIYFGGGTPSLLPPELIERITATIRSEFTVLPGAEITFEVAPATLADSTLAAMVAAGATRLSLGVQSFVDAEAKAVGRTHQREDVLRDLARAREAGIVDLNIDLLAGLPGQTRASWRESLDVLARIIGQTAGQTAAQAAGSPANQFQNQPGVTHASVYMLEVDEDSRLGTELLSGGARYGAQLVPKDETIVAMYEEAIEALARMGLGQYEISNFALPGCESRHNLRYWERKPYLGVGVDAHSMLRGAASAGNGDAAEAGARIRAGARGPAMRFASTDDLKQYLDGPGWSRPEPLAPAQELEEAWFLGLRRSAGVSWSALTAEFGAEPVEASTGVVEELVADGLLSREGEQIRLTGQGRVLSNDVFVRFLAEEPLA